MLSQLPPLLLERRNQLEPRRLIKRRSRVGLLVAEAEAEEAHQ